MPTRVLIAEDEWLIALALQCQLQRLGYEVVGVARTGAEAVRMCPLTKPDVVLMDVQMPEMDGLSATRNLMETCPQAIAIVTGRSTLREAAEEAGAMGFAVKPLLDSQLPSLIQEATQRFAWYRVVCEGAGDGEPAGEAWRVVRGALQTLMDEEGQSEAEAFDSLQRQASAHGSSLRETADEVLAAQRDRPSEQERGAA